MELQVEGAAGVISVTDTAPQDWDGGEPILLVHGINMSRDVWTDVASILRRKRRIVSFDLRGHGRSSMAGPFTLADYADDAFAVLDALDIIIAHVAGISFGGSVACAMAVKSPGRVSTVASFGGALNRIGFDIDSTIRLIRSTGVHVFFESLLAQGSFAPGTDRILIDRAMKAATANRDVETVCEIIRAAVLADTTALSNEVRVPALVVTGELDVTCPVKTGREVADSLRTAHVVLPKLGHVLSMEAPLEVANLIEKHINENCYVNRSGFRGGF